MFFKTSHSLASRLGAALLLATSFLMAHIPALTQDMPDADGSVSKIYKPEFFSVFQPQNAQNMVERLPGFTLQGGGNGRGFGQANLNILINGQRPSSKSTSANEILSRIATESVVHIEILDGASLDIPGLSGQVANIVTRTDKVTGNWEYAARFEQGTEPQILEGKISVSGSKGNLDYVASFESDHFTFSENGIEQFSDANGVQFENRIEQINYEQVAPSVGLNLTWKIKPEHIANLNLNYSGFQNQNFDARETLTATTPDSREGQTIFSDGENEINYEIGGDYSFPVSKGNLKLIGLHRYEDSEFLDTYREFILGQDPFSSRFTRQAIEGEYIARSEYNWKPGDTQDWQISLEGAFNVLDDTTAFENNTTIFAPQNVRVEEKRTEGFLTHSWAVSPAFNIQSALGAEYSRLDVTTSDDPAREFMRPKGSIALSYDLSPRYTLRSKIEREVGQLNFFDFVSSVSLTENTENGGNTKIVPTQFWNAEIEFERKDDKVLSGSIEAAIRLIEDPIDRIPLLGGGEGPGNLDTAVEYSAHGNGTWLLDHMGLNGMRLELDGGVHLMEIDDPVTGKTRAFNGETIWHINGTLTHDIPNTPYAWSLYLEKNQESKFFRLDQSFDNQLLRPFSSLGFTHKDLLGMRVSVIFQNLFDYKNNRTRQFFNGDRNGARLGQEFRSRQRGRRVSLTLADTF